LIGLPWFTFFADAAFPPPSPTAQDVAKWHGASKKEKSFLYVGVSVLRARGGGKLCYMLVKVRTVTGKYFVLRLVGGKP